MLMIYMLRVRYTYRMKGSTPMCISNKSSRNLVSIISRENTRLPKNVLDIYGNKSKVFKKMLLYPYVEVNVVWRCFVVIFGILGHILLNMQNIAAFLGFL